ncbi:MAG: DNA polymerase II large subunit [Methanomicrobia archaeon]|nr:DNA polymerase II large subunit [Methanomicrobia archaeon]
MEDYFESLERGLENIYKIAEEARKKGQDPYLRVEIAPARDMAARVEGLVGPVNVASKIRELDRMNYSREEIALKIAEEITEGKFGNYTQEKCAEQAVRTALAILTEGIVAAPLEGIAQVKIKENMDNTKFLSLYFAGPIRSAGGTAAALSILVGDYVRKKLSLGRYVPTEDEIERFIEEVELYDRVAHLQYYPSREELKLALQNIPIEVTGESTEKVEVSGYRDLERIETNRVRGGAMLAVCEGLLQKASKVLKYVEALKLDGWEWIREISSSSKKEEEFELENWKYLKEIIAGRPIFSYPSRRGGFRIRYGRSRNTGFAAWGVHPCTMLVLEDFLAIGTQMKTERPGKANIVCPVDTIEGPIVKMRNGDVIRLEDYDETLKLRDNIDKILFLGDALISYGDFLENNHILLPSGYVEEWWIQDLGDREKVDPFSISEEKAIELSEKYDIPLHPKYTSFWYYLSFDELKEFMDYLSIGEIGEKIILPLNDKKKLLEKICLEHRVSENRIIINSLFLKKINFSRFYEIYESLKDEDISDKEKIFKAFKYCTGIEIMDKCPYTVGGRMGRPEKAKERLMAPPVHSLFPVGNYGGKTRSIVKASNLNYINVDIINLKCPVCGEKTFKRKCDKCGAVTKLYKVCENEKCSVDTIETEEDRCPACNSPLKIHSLKKIYLNEEYKKALENLKIPSPKEVKGVIGMISSQKIPEILEKGILRAKNNVYVFKDGTIRFDCTDAPLTHFTPEEINVSVEKLKELGYTEDYSGNPINNEKQIIELKPHDVILPETGGEYLLRVSKFVDDCLEKIYGMKRYYNARTKEDLIGKLVIGLAPHTSAGVLGRIIGFSSTKVGYAHPFFHAAKRRNCDGDEDSFMLALEALLDFSKLFLPEKRGGKMDAPLVLTTKIDPAEVDKEVRNMDIVDIYPLEFYEMSQKFAKPQKIRIEKVGDRLGKENAFYGFKFTHNTSDISLGPKISAYKTLGAMEDKINAQLSLAEKIEAVDENDTAERLINSHFLPDLIGNMRAFSTQAFRCVDCNKKYRRVPLSGKCSCGGRLILTVSHGSVEKYLKISKMLLEKYDIDNYVKERIEIIEKSIETVFTGKKKQMSLADFL